MNRKKKVLYFIIFILLAFGSANVNAQCAGNDAEITICTIPDPANQTINLFDLLGPSAVSGGIWSDAIQTGSLDPLSGILNVWDIHLSGTYSFDYTVTATAGCTDNTATVTVIIGGYSGIPSPNGSACSDDPGVNLFSFFVGQLPSAHQDGTWADDNNTGALSGNVLDATASGLGTFSFTYTMAEVGTCPAKSSTVVVTVYRAPEPGDPTDLILCNTDDLSVYANLDLTTLLTGEDPNGRWTEEGTGQLSGPFDSFINVLEIYDTMQDGIYKFTYTVYPTNPICTPKTATIKIIIEKQLDFTGATLTINSDICENQIATATYSASLTQGSQPIPDGVYEVKYTITGATSTSYTVNAPFLSGILSFPLSAVSFQQVGNYTVSITDIKNLASMGACENIINVSDVLHIYPLPRLTNAALVINPVCKNSDATIQINGIGTWPNGDYQITYNLTGANTASVLQATITVSGGTATFTLAAALIPNIGNTTIAITNVTSVATGCTASGSLSKTFVVNGIPDVSGLMIAINDACKNQPVTVALSGLGSLTAIAVTYNLASANTASNQSVALAVNSGNASFVIPAGLISNTGNTVLTITSLTNTVTTCQATVNGVMDSFEINAIPDAPASANAVFCKTDNATIADLEPSGTPYKWYNSATSSTVLADDTLLVSGDYFVSQTNGTLLCSSERTRITVTVNLVPVPVLNPNGQQFCGADRPTLQELSNKVDAEGVLTWYATPSGGIPLENSELLQEGSTYYGFQYSDTVDCSSSEALSVTVTLTVCDNNGGGYDFFIPDGFSPNGDGVNDTFTIPDIAFLFPDYTLEIYNRYGNLMFKGNRNKPEWDGKNSESTNVIDGIAANGVYFYIVYFNKDNAGPKQGRLYLNR